MLRTLLCAGVLLVSLTGCKSLPGNFDRHDASLSSRSVIDQQLRVPVERVGQNLSLEGREWQIRELYFAASGTHCARLQQINSIRIGCYGAQGWYLVPDMIRSSSI